MTLTVIQPGYDPDTMPTAMSADYLLMNVIRPAVGLALFDAQKAADDSAFTMYQAIADVFAALSARAVRVYLDALVSSARDGAFGTGAIEVWRENADAGEVTLLAGSVVGTKDGRYYVTTDDAVMGVGVLGPVTAAIESAGQAEHYNVEGALVTAGAELVYGPISELILPLQDPPGADLTMFIRQVQPVENAAPAALDEIGKDRAMVRYPDEPADDYRARLMQLLTGITEEGISHSLRYVLGRRGINYTLLPGWSWAWNAPADLDEFDRTDLPSAAMYGYTEDYQFGFLDDPRYEFSTTQRWADDDGAGIGVVLLDESTEPGPDNRYGYILGVLFHFLGIITAYGYETLVAVQIAAPGGPTENLRMVPTVAISADNSGTPTIEYSYDPQDVPGSEVADVATWDVGDGSEPLTGQTVQHTYAGPGSYTVKLWVRNDINVLLARGQIVQTVT